MQGKGSSFFLRMNPRGVNWGIDWHEAMEYIERHGKSVVITQLAVELGQGYTWAEVNRRDWKRKD